MCVVLYFPVRKMQAFLTRRETKNNEEIEKKNKISVRAEPLLICKYNVIYILHFFPHSLYLAGLRK